MAYKTLNLDLAKSPILKSIVYGRIGDSDMQTVTVNITSRDTPVDLTGYIITFEGITNGEKTKVFDVDGISSTDEGLKKGTFDYTFPNMAFAVGGSYEIAYFSIVKGDKRDTTGEFDIIVGSNADIDAAEAETIISDSDAKFAAINAKIVDLQAKITQYQNTVKDTADGAIKAVEDALKQFEAGDFYTKEESDSRFAPQSLVNEVSDLKGVVNKKANDLEVVHLTGDETIAGKKTFSDDTIFKGDVAWTDINLSSQFTGGQPQVMVDRGKWLVVYLNDIKTATTLAANTPVNIIQLPVNMRTDRQQEKTVNIRIASEFVSCRLLLMSTGYIAVVPPKSIPSGSGFGITETFILI